MMAERSSQVSSEGQAGGTGGGGGGGGRRSAGHSGPVRDPPRACAAPLRRWGGPGGRAREGGDGPARCPLRRRRRPVREGDKQPSLLSFLVADWPQLKKAVDDSNTAAANASVGGGGGGGTGAVAHRGHWQGSTRGERGRGEDQFERNLALNLNPGSSLYHMDAQEMSAANLGGPPSARHDGVAGRNGGRAGGHWAGLSGAAQCPGGLARGPGSPHDSARPVLAAAPTRHGGALRPGFTNLRGCPCAQ